MVVVTTEHLNLALQKNSMNETDIMEIASKSKKCIEHVLKPKEPMKFIQHLPGYIDGDRFEMSFWNIKEVLEHEQIKWWSTRPKFYHYAMIFGKKQSALMAMFDYQPEYYGCMSWYCLGHIEGCGTIDLPIAFYGSHKANCWARKYESIREDTYGRDEETVKRMLKDLGWESDDMTGCAVKCTCGFSDYK